MRLLHIAFLPILALLLFAPSHPLFGQSDLPRAMFSYHRAGFFSCFIVLLGLLDSYEEGLYSGVEVDFGNSGYYYDEKKGSNWWQYYFEPIQIGEAKTTKEFLGVKQVNASALRVMTRLSKERSKRIIDKYIRIKKEITSEVENWMASHLASSSFVGVQYRGTDKFRHESSYISPEAMCQEIQSILKTEKCTSCPIFVATDTKEFLDLMKKTFGNRVVSYATLYSNKTTPLHRREELSGFIKGKEALIDCLILSKSKLLIHTISNLSTASQFFNPDLKAMAVNQNRWQPPFISL